VKEFKDKVAVITGAASGIGRGLAERCAEEGMKVVLAGINEDNLRLAEKEIKAKRGSTLVVKTDVSKASDVEALAQKTVDTFGAVHLLFNNAGVTGSSGGNAWRSTLADWQWILGVNLWGVIYGIHSFVPIMLKQSTECHIVNTSSAAGLVVAGAAYSVSKFGVVALSEALYRQLQQDGSNIGVSVLCPGWVKTNIISAERNRPPELKNSPSEEKANLPTPGFHAFLKQKVDNGISPEQVADIVFNAIKEKEFYIYADADSFWPMLETRVQDILKGRNPTSLGPPPR
jgi:NAD(P)-dependent dehydrogenase (short-subunit alcohol dehydrogenase family)